MATNSIFSCLFFGNEGEHPAAMQHNTANSHQKSGQLMMPLICASIAILSTALWHTISATLYGATL